MVTGALESHFSGARKNLQFVHLNERPERMKSEERLNHIYTSRQNRDGNLETPLISGNASKIH